MREELSSLRIDRSKARKASPVEATKSALARIDAFNPQLNAFQHLDPDSALRQARDEFTATNGQAHA